MLEEGLEIVWFNSLAVLREELFIFVSWSLNGLMRRVGAGANLIADVVKTDGATGVVEFNKLGTTFNSLAGGFIGGIYL